MTGFVEVLKDFGFPIAVCAILFWYVYHTNETNNKKIDSLQETIIQNTETLAGFEKALTNALNKFETVIFEVFKQNAGRQDGDNDE